MASRTITTSSNWWSIPNAGIVERLSQRRERLRRASIFDNLGLEERDTWKLIFIVAGEKILQKIVRKNELLTRRF